MKKKTVFIILALIFVFLLVGASLVYNKLIQSAAPDQLATQESAVHSEETAPQLMQAPDFTVYDAAGNEVKLSDYFGKPIVVNFWASWCGPCKMEMPDFQEKYQALGGEVTFLMVNMTDGDRETVEIASDFITEAGYTFPVLFDTASSAAMAYGVYSLPSTYFIDANGYAVARATGAIDGDTLQQGIDMIAL